nr:hypothetical protein [Propionispora hippei]
MRWQVRLLAKTFVTVTAVHNPDGSAKPLAIHWTDGRTFEIDRILDARQAASLKGGGWGMRYTCRIGGKQFFLFDEEGRWFVEK